MGVNKIDDICENLTVAEKDVAKTNFPRRELNPGLLGESQIS